MSISIRPTAGQVALIELEDLHRAGFERLGPLTGTISPVNSGVLSIVGLSPPDVVDGSEVVVSVFTPEALYRIRAAVHWGVAGSLTIEPIHDVERIERRSWPRHALHLNVTLVALDGPSDDLAGVAGRTIDVGVAGLRVETISPLPPGADVTVMLNLPDGTCLTSRTTVVSAHIGDSSCEYRLVFDPLDDIDAARLLVLVGSQTALAVTA